MAAHPTHWLISTQVSAARTSSSRNQVAAAHWSLPFCVSTRIWSSIFQSCGFSERFAAPS